MLYFTRDQVVEVAIDDDEAVVGVELREGVILLDVLRDQVRAVGAELEDVDAVVHEEAVSIADEELEDPTLDQHFG
eukprot:9991311-Alexandrium_andersonii.AAC.1